MRIIIYGRPITQGSKIRTRWSMRDANGDTLHPWRDNVRSAAIHAYNLDGTNPIGTAPCNVTIIFTFARPTSHFGTGRNSKNIKTSAPPSPSSHSIGDIDKLTRACLDALTDAGIWLDDSQVCELHAAKVFTGTPGALDKPGAIIDILAIKHPTHSSRDPDVDDATAHTATNINTLGEALFTLAGGYDQ